MFMHVCLRISNYFLVPVVRIISQDKMVDSDVAVLFLLCFDIIIFNRNLITDIS